jgi:hypothetical protein
LAAAARMKLRPPWLAASARDVCAIHATGRRGDGVCAICASSRPRRRALARGHQPAMIRYR